MARLPNLRMVQHSQTASNNNDVRQRLGISKLLAPRLTLLQRVNAAEAIHAFFRGLCRFLSRKASMCTCVCVYICVYGIVCVWGVGGRVGDKG